MKAKPPFDYNIMYSTQVKLVALKRAVLRDVKGWYSGR